MTDLSGLMRAAFRKYPTGVAVVSAPGPVGLTLSSVASVSVDPPAISFSVMSTTSARAVLDAPSLVVQFLGPDHVQVARDFARPGGPRFTPAQGWITLPTGEPMLPAAVAALRAKPFHRVRVGESTLLVAEVLEVFEGRDTGRLIYHGRTFVTSPPRDPGGPRDIP